MPRYYFNTEFNGRTFKDTEGTDLVDDQAARDEATMAMAEMAGEYITGPAPQTDIAMFVRSDSGEPLFQLDLTCAVSELRVVKA